MRNSISKGILSRFAELSRSGGGVRAVKLTLCAALHFAAAGAQPSADWIIDTFAGSDEVVDGASGTQARLNRPLAWRWTEQATSTSPIHTTTGFARWTPLASPPPSRIERARFGGDGSPATQAQLYYPSGVALDGAGNLYIADTANHRIRKMDSSGVITTIAGTGERGFGGDGGPATQARLNRPSGVTVDGAGNVYIADTWNHRIRKMDSSGVITTIAGTGERGFGGDYGPATQAQLNAPCVTVDGAGNVYIADTWNHRDSQGGPFGNHHHFHGHGKARVRQVRRGRRPSDPGAVERPLWRDGGRGRQRLHR